MSHFLRKAVVVGIALAASGCSLRQAAVDHVATLVAGSGAGYAADDDPELIRAAAPFSLKLIEGLLAESPRHEGLLLAAARGFTQYAYAFVQQEAEEREERDLAAAVALQDRARRLYRRGRDYGLRGLEVRHPGISTALRKDPRAAAAALDARDLPLAFWTAASWAALIALSKDRPEVLADLGALEALLERAVALDEAYERGAIHVLLITYEALRPGAGADAANRSRRHYARAIALSDGLDAAPRVALAEAVCLPQRRSAEFRALLEAALHVDADRSPAARLANLVAQRRARWLLGRMDRLFPE